MTREKTIAIFGIPRSGTTWLAQIVDSSPRVTYRYQPLFSYAFKDYLNIDSDPNEYYAFLDAIYESDDEFMHQVKNKKEGHYPHFEKNEVPDVLCFKNTRYQYLLPKFLAYVDNLKAIGIVRHPCAVLNSWFTTPREFPEGTNPLDVWRDGSVRNTKPEEAWGFEKWKWATDIYLSLEEEYPERFRLQNYENLVENPFEQSKELFEFLSLEYTNQTNEFIIECHTKHDPHEDAVFKNKSVKDKWKQQLNPTIQKAVIEELSGTRFERFL